MRHCKYLFIIVIVMLMLVGHKESAYAQTAQDSTISLLKDVYSNFESSVKDKMSSAHLDLFISQESRVNIVGKNYGDPRFILNTANSWSNYFSGLSVPYRLDISDENYEIFGNVALSVAQFEEFRNGDKKSEGIDLFVYVATTKGWKYAYINNTFLLNNDKTSYANHQINGTPQQVLKDICAAFNSTKAMDYKSQFVSPAMPCFIMDSMVGESFDNTTLKVSDFVNSSMFNEENLKLEIDSIKADIVDDYLAKSVANFTFTRNDSIRMTGQLITTFMGKKDLGWKVSGQIFMVTKHYMSTPIKETALEELTSISSLKIYPNPFDEEISVDFSVNGQHNNNPVIGVYNMSGMLICSQLLSHQQGGNYTCSLSPTHAGTNLSTGMYLVKVETGVSSSFQKVIKY